MKVVTLERKSDVKETLEAALKEHDDYECVVVIGFRKDTSTAFNASMMSLVQLSYLAHFMQTFVVQEITDNHEFNGSA